MALKYDVRHSTARSQRHRGEDLDRRPAIARGRANARARTNSENLCVTAISLARRRDLHHDRAQRVRSKRRATPREEIRRRERRSALDATQSARDVEEF
jgi:hypothetical protein